jgi:hypothetical protein
MLAYCTEDGLTVGEQVLRKGMVFKLPAIIEAAVSGYTEEGLNRYQKRVYGKTVFRRPTSEELVIAFQKNNKIIDVADVKEKQIIQKRLLTAVEKRKKALEDAFGTLPENELENMLEETTESGVESPVKK